MKAPDTHDCRFCLCKIPHHNGLCCGCGMTLAECKPSLAKGDRMPKQDPFRKYDRWKTRSPEDEDDEQTAKLRRLERLMERADEMRDREKDERHNEKT